MNQETEYQIPFQGHFITEYQELMREISDISVDFTEATAHYLLSTFAGRNFYANVLSDISFGKTQMSDRYLNVWYILMAKSRIGRKSSGVTNKCEDIVNDIKPDLLLANRFS